MIYAECLWPCSRDWSPVKFHAAPTVKGDRVVLSGGPGPRVRALVEVPRDHHHLTLPQLAAVYGTDGHLRATQGRN